MIWGSFLNVVAYRLIHNQSLLGRSRCPHCRTIIAWYDNIPLISWFLLHGHCRNCKKNISWLYPFIEALTLISLIPLYYLQPAYFLSYFIFFSALIVTIRTDIETLQISVLATLFLVPFAWLAAWFSYLPIGLHESLLATFVGYGLLWSINKIFFYITNKDGIGQGDFDLLALIGAVTGLVGLWFTLLCSSIAGVVVGSFLLIGKPNKRAVKLPFGPFLAFAAMLYVLLQPFIFSFFIE